MEDLATAFTPDRPVLCRRVLSKPRIAYVRHVRIDSLLFHPFQNGFLRMPDRPTKDAGTVFIRTMNSDHAQIVSSHASTHSNSHTSAGKQPWSELATETHDRNVEKIQKTRFVEFGPVRILQIRNSDPKNYA